MPYVLTHWAYPTWIEIRKTTLNYAIFMSVSAAHIKNPDVYGVESGKFMALKI